MSSLGILLIPLDHIAHLTHHPFLYCKTYADGHTACALHDSLHHSVLSLLSRQGKILHDKQACLLAVQQSATQAACEC